LLHAREQKIAELRSAYYIRRVPARAIKRAGEAKKNAELRSAYYIGRG
jgi:hypothetical protein